MRTLGWTLFAISAANYLDRLVFSLLQETIRIDLGLSDLQMGLAAGPVFAGFYAVGSLIAIVIEDNRHRKTIIGVSAICWGLMTQIGGLASGLAVILLSRAGIGLFEAIGIPGAQSMATDKQTKGAGAVRPLGHFFAGAPTGAILAFIIRGGSGKLHSGDKWNFCLNLA